MPPRPQRQTHLLRIEYQEVLVGTSLAKNPRPPKLKSPPVLLQHHFFQKTCKAAHLSRKKRKVHQCFRTQYSQLKREHREAPPQSKSLPTSYQPSEARVASPA